MAFDSQAFAAGQTASGNGVTDMLGQQMATLQMQAAQQQVGMQRIALARQQQYTQDVQSFAQNPTVQGLASLWKYPEFQANTKGIYDAMDPRMRQAEATQLGSFASVLQNAQQKDGSYDPAMLKEASNLIQARIDADKASGRDTTGDEQALAMVQSGDPKQINAVKAMTAGLIAGNVGFDKAADFLKGIGLSQEPVKTTPGDTYTNPVTGQALAAQPSNLSPQTLNVPGGGQELVGFNPNPGAGGGSVGTGATQTEGGGPASGAGAAGPQAAVATVLHNEGGLNKSDMNGYPTNFGINYKANKAELAAVGINSPAQMGNLTREQAAQIYATKYWPQSGAANLPANLQTPYFDVYVRNPALAKKALAQSGGDPQKFMQIASGYFQNMAANNPKAAKYQKAWANRDANNLAIATGSAPQGGAQAVAPVGTPPPGGAVVLANTGNTGALNTEGAQPGYAWNSTHTAQVPVPGSTADFSPQALDTATMQYALTGQLPGGMGGGAIKAVIIKNLPTFLQAHGLAANDLPGIQKTYKGLSTALDTAQQTASALNAAQVGLQHDQQLVLTTRAAMEKAAQQAGIPLRDGGILSSWTNRKTIDALEDHGSPEQQSAAKAYLDAVNAFARTYGKFMSAANGVGGSGAPSDASQAMANELNDEGMGMSALKAHLATVMKEANNKRTGWESQAQLLQSKIHGLIPGASESSAPVHVNSIQQAQSLPSGTLFVAPNGKTYRKR